MAAVRDIALLGVSYLSNLLALHLRPFRLPFISQHSKQGIGHYHR